MTENILNLLKNLPAEVTVCIISMLPIIELRGAIPVAIVTFHLSWLKAYIISVIGNLIPVIPILFLFKSIRKFLSVIPFLAKFFDWTEKRAYAKGEKIIRYGAIGLTLFVAIPLPMTGAWTGSLIALLFGIKPKFAIPAITLGVLIAGIIVTLSVLGIKLLF